MPRLLSAMPRLVVVGEVNIWPIPDPCQAQAYGRLVRLIKAVQQSAEDGMEPTIAIDGTTLAVGDMMFIYEDKEDDACLSMIHVSSAMIESPELGIVSADRADLTTGNFILSGSATYVLPDGITKAAMVVDTKPSTGELGDPVGIISFGAVAAKEDGWDVEFMDTNTTLVSVRRDMVVSRTAQSADVAAAMCALVADPEDLSPLQWFTVDKDGTKPRVRRRTVH